MSFCRNIFGIFHLPIRVHFDLKQTTDDNNCTDDLENIIRTRAAMLIRNQDSIYGTTGNFTSSG